MQQGLSEDQITALNEYSSSSHFSNREKLALEYADRITRSDRDVDDAFFAELEKEFSTPEEVVELTAVVAFENFRSKFNHALLVESNGTCRIDLGSNRG